MDSLSHNSQKISITYIKNKFPISYKLLSK
nr:MAG TPA: hypothetical protein [Crassvirales sp.]